MSLAIHVLCRTSGLTRAKLLEHIDDEIDFCDKLAPRFEPERGAAALHDDLWDRLDVHYDGDELLQFAMADAQAIQQTVEELLAMHLPAIRDQDCTDLETTLRETRQMITIRVGFGGDFGGDEVERAVWDMLSCVEVCVATDHDGVIVAAEGIYDAKLERLVRF